MRALCLVARFGRPTGVNEQSWVRWTTTVVGYPIQGSLALPGLLCSRVQACDVVIDFPTDFLNEGQ